jgi:hypothetical protein
VVHHLGSTIPPVREETNFPKTREQTILYRPIRDDNKLSIVPAFPYVDAIRRGDPVQAVRFMWSPFRWTLPCLDFKLANLSDNPIFLTRAAFDVQSSEPNLSPLLVVREACPIEYFQILNEGWGDANGCTLSFNVTRRSERAKFETPYAYDIFMGTIDAYNTSENGPADTESGVIDLQKVFRRLGVDVDAIKSRAQPSSLGGFDDGIAILSGQISYRYTDHEGHGRAALMKFSATVVIGPSPCMMYAPTSHKYNLLLDVDNEGYSRELEISQVLAPRGADRFQMCVGALKSSSHIFKVRLFYNSGQEFSSKTIGLDLIIPRSQAHRIRSSEGD